VPRKWPQNHIESTKIISWVQKLEIKLWNLFSSDFLAEDKFQPKFDQNQPINGAKSAQVAVSACMECTSSKQCENGQEHISEVSVSF
jgi:hypothetical protein